MKRIAILGAGASGLTSLKACLEEGLTPVCFEKTDAIGGLWKYRDKDDFPNLACVFKSTYINSSKENMSFSDFPVPPEWPNFMHNTYVLKYFYLYAEKFDLLKHIRFNTAVVMITPADDFDETGQWVIDLKNEQTGVESRETFDGVMVCSGHHAIPNIPKFEGQGAFKGQVIHTHDYRVPEPFTNKRVLVVGIGNSAGDAAVDMSRVTKQVYLSTRRGAWVLKRTADKGLPSDVIFSTRFGTMFPLWLMNNLGESGANKTFDHEIYGLRPKHRIFSAHPTVNDELPSRIINGSVKVKGQVGHFTENGVVFVDGSVVEGLDAVVFGTGYKIQFPFLPKSVIDVKDNNVSLYKYVFLPDSSKQTLAFIGLAQPLGSTISLAELQARWVARVFAGAVEVPNKNVMWEDIIAKRGAMMHRYVSSDRHTIQVDMIPYCDEIASQFGVKPNLWNMFKTDRALFFKLIFWPHLPYSYRLDGPGKWEGAKDAIENVWNRVRCPLHVQRDGSSKQKDLQGNFTFYIMFLVIAVAILYIYM